MRLVPAAAAFALVLAGCIDQETTGFVELKRTFPLGSSTGAYRLNGEDIAGLAAPDSNATVVLRRKTGPMRLDFVREPRTWELCSFDLAKNRIVTVTIYLDGRDIRCAVQT